MIYYLGVVEDERFQKAAVLIYSRGQGPLQFGHSSELFFKAIKNGLGPYNSTEY
jgi:hypothetical protein